ncbi:hypothetical protein PLICRDRAFT_638523 [Plicaturopsis crispa FD-325 SS-3]|nr:hypothetical protein PLICRDRAFT_638523 [Plicaturopsis crispa FD-325 SS-3]
MTHASTQQFFSPPVRLRGVIHKIIQSILFPVNCMLYTFHDTSLEPPTPRSHALSPRLTAFMPCFHFQPPLAGSIPDLRANLVDGSSDPIWRCGFRYRLARRMAGTTHDILTPSVLGAPPALLEAQMRGCWFRRRPAHSESSRGHSVALARPSSLREDPANMLKTYTRMYMAEVRASRVRGLTS